MASTFVFTVSHGNRTEIITLGGAALVGDLKTELRAIFDIAEPKVLGLPPHAPESATLSSLSPPLKAVSKLMLVGASSAALAAQRLAAEAAVIAGEIVDDDLEPPDDADEADASQASISADEVARAQEKILKRIASYRPKMLAGFRPNMHTLVLDVD